MAAHRGELQPVNPVSAAWPLQPVLRCATCGSRPRQPGHCSVLRPVLSQNRGSALAACVACIARRPWQQRVADGP
eukprot:14820851-Alexandrium_andersonii.AAC.1